MTTEMTDLFGIAMPDRRAQRRDEVRTMKKKYGIWTHAYHDHRIGWFALSLPECCAFLEGYSISEEERRSGAALMAGYARLLEDAGLIEDGKATEFLACQSLVQRVEAGRNITPPGECK